MFPRRNRAFASQLAKQNFPHVKAQDWNNLFWLLAEKTQTGQVIILLDEISWMGSCDPDFLGKLKNVWDQYFKKNPKLMLILCGSASSWIVIVLMLNRLLLYQAGILLSLCNMKIWC